MRSEALLREFEEKLGFVKRYSGFDPKLDEIAEAAQYIASVNASLKNYEIAKWTDKIIRLVGEIK